MVIPPPPVTILTVALPDGVVGLSYNATLVAVNGRPPFTWSVASGSGPLPPGLSLNGSTGVVTGTPTTTGTFDFTIRVTDSNGGTDTKAFTVDIGDAIPLVTRVSLANDGSEANGDSGTPALSDTGRFVAFTSFATNLVTSDTNNLTDIFLRDRTCNATLRVSVASDGTEANGQSFAPAISALTGGTIVVAYASEATNLVSNDTNNQVDIFATAVTVSGCTLAVASTVRANIGIRLPNQTADIFTATTIGNSALQMATDVHIGGLAEIVAGTGAGQARTITTNDATTLTVDPAWTPPPDGTSVFRVVAETNSLTGLPNLSADGRLVSYQSASTNLVDADTNFTFDAFVTELQFAGGILGVVDTGRLSTLKLSLAVRLAVSIPNTPADIFSTTTIGNSGLTLTPDEHVGRVVQIVSGTGQGQTRSITANDPTTLTLDPAWDPEPDGTSVFRVVRDDETADLFSANTIGKTTLNMTAGEHVGRQAEITSGTGQGQRRTITANDATTLTVTPDWDPVPDDTSVFRVLVLADHSAEIFSGSTIGNFSLAMRPNEHQNRVVEIITGTGAGQARTVVSNRASSFSFSPGWAILPDATSVFRVVLQGSGATSRVKLSADGSFAAFTSASVFEAADTNSTPDVFLQERATGILSLQSVDTAGALANGASTASALDGRGDNVLFLSTATNLVSEDNNSVGDLFVRNRTAPLTERVSVDSAGAEADNISDETAGLSGGGRLVAFASAASNLATADRNGNLDIFLRDRTAGTTTRVSQAMGGVNPNGASIDPSISLDGSTIAFASEATNLVPGDTNGARDIFVFSTSVSDPPLLVSSSTPAARRGVPYQAQLLAVSGAQPLHWSIEEGVLPPGLFLDARTGTISGVPQKTGSFPFTLVVMDAERPVRQTRLSVTLVVNH